MSGKKIIDYSLLIIHYWEPVAWDRLKIAGKGIINTQ
jgi:hypothetical protein